MKKKHDLAINGRIFEYPITGVGRFCFEVISEMDKILPAGQCELLVSKNSQNIPLLKNIKIRKIGKGSGIFWEQVELPLYLKLKKLKCLSMSSSVPIFAHDYVLIHDISLKVNKDIGASLKEKLKIWWPLFQYKVGIKYSEIFFTDSVFQKEEIRREYHTDKEINVVYAGWQHMNRIKEDGTIITRLNLVPQNYMFALSTRAKNKNFKWILKVAENNPDMTFVISGKLETKYFSDQTNYDEINNIITTGYVTDSEMKSLIKNAKAFLYPSIYEGFGIPPLEAMSLGTEVIVAKASCLPEICGESAYYVDPYQYNIDIQKILAGAKLSVDDTLAKYSWEKTARLILAQIQGGNEESE